MKDISEIKSIGFDISSDVGEKEGSDGECKHVFQRREAVGRHREKTSLFLCKAEGPEGAPCRDAHWGAGSRKLVL